jgi:hypothetical protein
MRLAFTLLAFWGTFFSLSAQCRDFELSHLQTVQRAEISLKDARITELGFDIIAENATSYRYNKCWQGNRGGRDIYTQVIWQNKQTGNITFLTNDKEAFLRLRQSIEERRGATSTMGQSDIYIGKMFRYEFFIQNLDGMEYYAVAIRLK